MFVSKKKYERLNRQVVLLQHAVDSVIVNSPVDATATMGNPYPTYSAKAVELSAKYDGTATWGCQLAKSLVDVRAAFVIGRGVKTSYKGKTEKDSRELDFIQEFIRLNNLDEEVPQNWATEAEIEGKFLGRLFPDQKEEQIRVRFVPWTQYGYTVVNYPGDYATYVSVSYDLEGVLQTLSAKEFVYARFGGRTNKVNDTPSVIAQVLRPLEALDKALVDWRKINGYFSSPTPYFKCEDRPACEALYAKLKAMSWKIGKFLVGTADFSLISADSAGIESLLKEIVTNVKIISGSTGVPPHFLGFPDLVSNRSTADNLMEFINASTSKARCLWVGAYDELFRKVLVMANEKFQKGFDPNVIQVAIPEANAAMVRELVEIWLPLYEKKALSRETLISKIPGVDTKEELDKIKAEKDIMPVEGQGTLSSRRPVGETGGMDG